MDKFKFKDTDKQIKVGDVVWVAGNSSPVGQLGATNQSYQNENNSSNEMPFIPKKLIAKNVEHIVKSCKVQRIDNLYKDYGGFIRQDYYLLTDDINNPDFTIHDHLYSSQEACNYAMKISKLQENIFYDVSAIHDIDKLKDIINFLKK